MSKISIILISGKQGSGKTSLAKALRAELLKQVDGASTTAVVQMTFAEPLYDMHNFCVGYLEDNGIKRGLKKDGRLLQLLGTEWGRESVDPDLWVKLAQSRVEKIAKLKDGYQHIVFIFSDCRFQNEFNAFPGALSIRLECDREIRKERCEQWRDTDTHPSETDLDTYAYPANHTKFAMIFHTDYEKNTPMGIAHAIAEVIR